MYENKALKGRRMIEKIKKAFGEEGICFKKKISLHFSLQKGKNQGKSLGSFDFDMNGCSNLARKTTFFIALFAIFAATSMFFRSEGAHK